MNLVESIKVHSNVDCTKRHCQNEWAEDVLFNMCPSWCHERCQCETTEQMKGDLSHWMKVQSAEQFKQFFRSTLVTSHPLGARVERKLGFAPEIIGVEPTGRMWNVVADPDGVFHCKAPERQI